MKFQPKSLQQRTFLFILLPTFALLVVLSAGGLTILSRILQDQWGEIAVARLQRTAHLVDMDLRRPKDLLLLLQQDEEREVLNREIFSYILNKIEDLDSVVEVNVIRPAEKLSSLERGRFGIWQHMENVHRYQIKNYDISSPRYNTRLNNRTVTLVSVINNDQEQELGKIEIVISFDALIERVITSPWWRNYRAYIIDANGNVLVSTGNEEQLEDKFPMRAFGSLSELEHDTLMALDKYPFGTVFGPGIPPNEISGFYHLSEAPWSLVIIAPGAEVLAPLIKFRTAYIVAFSLCIFIILLVIRRTVNRVTSRIKEVSEAAGDLAAGSFGPSLEVKGRDEVEELRRNFNSMTSQLRQRLAMKKAISIAREVQQNLLPQDLFTGEGISVSGATIYCDETGGDYLDILHPVEGSNKITVVVGDVVGHGIGAALLMTSVRALLRCRIAHPGSPAQIITDINKLLYQDTNRSGRFVTLFYVEIDRENRVMHWVRAGHDPAIVYHPSTGAFSELRGSGIALGVDSSSRFQLHETVIPQQQQIVLIASDGAWEVENSRAEQFGKERLKRVLVNSSAWQADEIVQEIVRHIEEFRGAVPQNDDITLAVIKTS
jgi:sigma-B regulation protein RsbU (phosphoserine phosphatase)